MMQLGKDLRSRHSELQMSLRKAEQRLRMDIVGANVELGSLLGQLAHSVSKYNEARKRAAEFANEVSADAREKLEERSERWQQSEKGEALLLFAEQWEEAASSLEQDIEPPVLPDIETDDDINGARLFEDLPMETEA